MTTDISIPGMAIVYALLLIPIGAFLVFSIGRIKALLIGTIRMTIQLVLVGLYLGYIFELNNPFVNVGWVLVMISVANWHTLKGASISQRMFFPGSFFSILLGTAFVTIVFIGLAVRPTPLYDARYVIPVSGMVLGNCLRANIIVLERFFSGVRDNPLEWRTYLSLGATRYEAVIPFLRKALQAALTPTLTTMTTMGIVSLPGMMTGQILGGSFPLVAIKYQIAIMICILTSATITSAINLMLGIRIGFDEYGNLRPDVASS